MCAVGIKINPVTEWDGKKVGTGEVGPFAKELKKILHEEAKYSTTYEDVIQLKFPPSAKVHKVPKVHSAAPEVQLQRLEREADNAIKA